MSPTLLKDCYFLSLQAVEFFFFAACIGAVAILFAIMSFFYKYVDLSKRVQASNLASDEDQDESRALVVDASDSRRTSYTKENAPNEQEVDNLKAEPSESEL